MTKEQIKQNAEKWAIYGNTRASLSLEILYQNTRDAYIESAQSMLEEIKDLSIAATGLAKENKELKIKLAELRNQWINASKQLPPEDKDNSGYSVKVIGMFTSGHTSDCFCSLEEDIWFIDIFTCDKPMYWMKIPKCNHIEVEGSDK